MWGKGKGGWGKGGWGWGGKGYGGSRPSKPPSNTVPVEFEVPPTPLTGVVTAYYKFQGYGFITLDQKGLVPTDKVFVLWKSITTPDRFPMLAKDMEVQFFLSKEEKRGVMTLAANNVTMKDGTPIMLQDSSDTKKTFVGGQRMRYTGMLKFFIPKRGYGYITIDDGFQYDMEGVPKEICIETAEMACGGQNPGYMKDLRVEFGIWQTKKGTFKGYNCTLPGGVPLPAAGTEIKDDGVTPAVGMPFSPKLEGPLVAPASTLLEEKL